MVQILMDAEVHICHSLIFHSGCFLEQQTHFPFVQTPQPGRGEVIRVITAGEHCAGQCPLTIDS